MHQLRILKRFEDWSVDLYGHLIPGGNKQAVDRLDQPLERPLLLLIPQPGRNLYSGHQKGMGLKYLKRLEPATRIERATCGLRNSKNPTSDNLSPQETTEQDASEVGTDGPELSCPCSSVVADDGRTKGCI